MPRKKEINDDLIAKIAKKENSTEQQIEKKIRNMAHRNGWKSSLCLIAYARTIHKIGVLNQESKLSIEQKDELKIIKNFLITSNDNLYPSAIITINGDNNIVGEDNHINGR